MGAVVRRLTWFFVVACVVAYAVFIVAGSVIHEQNASSIRSVKIRDVVERSVHYMSGMVMVPSTCTDLFVRTEQHSRTLYELVFTTWAQPSIPCVEEETPRAFNAVVFAPSVGATFIASIDNVPLPITVIPVYSKGIDHVSSTN